MSEVYNTYINDVANSFSELLNNIHNNNNNNVSNGFSKNNILDPALVLFNDIEEYSFKKVLNGDKEEYTDISKILSSKYGKIDYSEVLDEGFKVQGVTEIENQVVISAYDHKKPGGSQRKSRLYFYDVETGEKSGYIILDSDAHVGGTTYVEELGVLFVSNSSGKTTALDFRPEKFKLLMNTMKKFGYKDLSSEDTSLNDKAFIIKNDLKVSDITDVGRNSTMYYDDGYLYIATYSKEYEKIGQVVKFKIDKDSISYPKEENNKIVDGNIKSEVVDTYTIPDMTQGVAVTKYNGEQYIITSQSYSDVDSLITIQKVTEYGLVDVGVKVLDRPGAESLHIDENGNLVCVFEKGEACVTRITMDDLFNNLVDSKDSSILSIRYSQRELAQAGSYAEDLSKDMKNLWTTPSPTGKGNSDFGDVLEEYAKYAGKDGVVGTAKGLFEAFGDTISDYKEAAEDSFGVVHHFFNGALESSTDKRVFTKCIIGDSLAERILKERGL